MSGRILITEPIIPSVIAALEQEFEVDVGERGDFETEQQLVDAVPGYDALLPMLSNPVTARVIEAGDSLKVIANHAVGYNNIDLGAARERGIRVANTPGVLTESSADCAIALMLAAARHICDAQQYLRRGAFSGWEPLGFLGMELSGRILGVFGMGRIGTAVARRARGFGMKIHYHNRSSADPEVVEELEAVYRPTLQELAREADILTVHCPLTEETRHAVDRDLLELMPEHAVLVNTARGPVVDEAALAEALHRESIAGAGLDVFEEEPEVHPRLLSAPRCVITPHIASATRESRTAIGNLAAGAIRSVLRGTPEEEIPNLVC